MGNHNAAAPALGIDVLRKLSKRRCGFCDRATTWLVTGLRGTVVEITCDICSLSHRFNPLAFGRAVQTHRQPQSRAWGLQQLIIYASSYDERAELLSAMMGDHHEQVRCAAIQLARSGALIGSEAVLVTNEGLQDKHPGVVAMATEHADSLRTVQEALSDAVPSKIRYDVAVYQDSPTEVTRSGLYYAIKVQEDPGVALLSVMALVASGKDSWWLARVARLIPVTAAEDRDFHRHLVRLAGGSASYLDRWLCERAAMRSIAVERRRDAVRLMGVVGGRHCRHTLRELVAGEPHLKRSATEALGKLEERLEAMIGGMSISADESGGLTVTDDGG